MRNLVGCGIDQLIAGLVMVGIPKSDPKERRVRRAFDGNVFRDLS